jgi:hypothetical protein
MSRALAGTRGALSAGPSLDSLERAEETLSPLRPSRQLSQEQLDAEVEELAAGAGADDDELRQVRPSSLPPLSPLPSGPSPLLTVVALSGQEPYHAERRQVRPRPTSPAPSPPSPRTQPGRGASPQRGASVCVGGGGGGAFP